MPKKKYIVSLTPEERQKLEQLTKKGKNPVVSQIINGATIFLRKSSNLSGYSKDLIDERDLSHDISFLHILDLSFSDHIHRFVAFDGSSR